MDAAERHRLFYYHEVVARSLGHTPDNTFWVVHVPQVLEAEPAARHAVLAISALHEEFVATLPNRASSRLDDLTGFTARLGPANTMSARSAYALGHYNKAINLVLGDTIQNVNALLTISLLFTCIELLQGGTDAAAKHCQHGIRTQGKSGLPPEISTAFLQLSFFSNTFDASSNLDFPKSTPLLGSPGVAYVDDIGTVSRACQTLDAITAHGARLIRLAAASRHGIGDVLSMQDLKIEQFHIRRAMSLWWEQFVTLKRRLTIALPVADAHIAALRLLETRWLVSNILASSCLFESETDFDLYLDDFCRIVELADQEKTARDATGFAPPSFTFDMGYLPLLFIVGTKCRSLRTRVRALVLMKELACEREIIWDACFLYASVKWAIELEHGLSLDEKLERATLLPDECLPSDAARIVAFDNTGNARWGVDSNGCAVIHRDVIFHTCDAVGAAGPLQGYTTIKPRQMSSLHQ